VDRGGSDSVVTAVVAAAGVAAVVVVVAPLLQRAMSVCRPSCSIWTAAQTPK